MLRPPSIVIARTLWAVPIALQIWSIGFLRRVVLEWYDEHHAEDGYRSLGPRCIYNYK